MSHDRGVLVAFLLAFTGGCTASDEHAGKPRPDTLVVYSAASLATPMRAALDTFARRTGAVVQVEHGASLELARRITELRRIPDVIALADHEVFPELLMPSHASWYATFARNRMVIAYTDRSRHAAEATSEDWRALLMRDDVLVGRTDPVIAPAGYRALIVYALAESFYRDSGLARRLSSRTPPELLRGNAAELAALLSAGELDYIVEYESLARAHGFRILALPAQIDLGTEAQSDRYATAAVRVATRRDSVTRRGTPILYGLSVPRRAPHRATGVRFAQMLLGADGQAILRRGYVDALERPRFVGDSVPVILRTLAP